MSDIVVRPLDVLDDAEFAAAYDAYVRGETHGRGDHGSVMGADSLRSGFTRPRTSRARWAWAAWRDGRPVGMAAATLPLSDNKHLCYADVAVAPEHRRSGIGGALLDRVELATRTAGRRVVVVEVHEPIEAADWPGTAFATVRGYALALREAHAVLTLPLPDERLRADPRDGYRVVAWRDHCPDEWAEPYCALLSSFHDEAPTGDLDVEAAAWTVDRLRDEEELRVARGRRSYVSAGVSPAGELAGYTELVTLPDDADAQQEETLVRPEHRGHRLGVALKSANLAALHGDDPDRRRVHTYVSPTNDPMNTVNRALGFEPVEYCDEWQRDLA